MSDYETLEDEASSDAQWQTSEIRSAKPNWSSFAQSKLISEAYAPCQLPSHHAFPLPRELPAALAVSACSLPRCRARVATKQAGPSAVFRRRGRTRNRES